MKTPSRTSWMWYRKSLLSFCLIVGMSGNVMAQSSDQCPNDPNKTSPGVCGCNTPDIDSDGDGMMDCNDQCPDDAEKVELGICGCGEPDIDSDGDFVYDCDDQCPEDPEKTEPGVCGCGEFDIIDNQTGETVCADDSFQDLCPDDPNKTEPGFCGCGELDIIDNQTGYIICENDPFEDWCPDDPNKTDPGVCGCGEIDIIDNQTGEIVCSDDPSNDLCPDDPNKTSPGVCGCGELDIIDNQTGQIVCENDPFSNPQAQTSSTSNQGSSAPSEETLGSGGGLSGVLHTIGSWIGLSSNPEETVLHATPVQQMPEEIPQPEHQLGIPLVLHDCPSFILSDKYQTCNSLSRDPDLKAMFVTDCAQSNNDWCHFTCKNGSNRIDCEPEIAEPLYNCPDFILHDRYDYCNATSSDSSSKAIFTGSCDDTNQSACYFACKNGSKRMDCELE